MYVNNSEKTSRSQIVSNLCKNLKNPSNFINVSLSQQSELSKMLSKKLNCVWCLNTVLVIREVKFHLVGATNGSSWPSPLQLLVPPPFWYTQNQRWSLRGRPWPREHTLKSLALASSLVSSTPPLLKIILLKHHVASSVGVARIFD